MESEIKWARFKNGPNKFFKPHHMPSKYDNTVEYYNLIDKQRCIAWLDEIEFIEEDNVPQEIRYLWDRYECGRDTKI
ncbi:MAG: hypothetical protein HDR97_02265 [Bacteroides sp.]|nr:hypothetical protein [Bacteroides sp.]